VPDSVNGGQNFHPPPTASSARVPDVVAIARRRRGGCGDSPDTLDANEAPALREVREFLMVTWLIQKAADDARAAAEAPRRINALRTGVSRKDWQPY
jgi:hypothetical protein